MQIDLETLSTNQRYHLLTQTIIPRPIAWVLSENEDSSLNLAPFSFFNAMCSNPALLVLSIGKKAHGARKDTALNLLSGREFIVHIANASQAPIVNKTSATLDYGDSELNHTDLALCDFEGANLPRLADCDIAYHCSLYEHHFVGPDEQTFIYAHAHSVFLSDRVATQDGGRLSVNANEVDPLSRLGATEYAGIGPSFKVVRPK